MGKLCGAQGRSFILSWVEFLNCVVHRDSKGNSYSNKLFFL